MRPQLERHKPIPWASRKQEIRRSWTRPFWALEWFWEWIAYLLGSWKFLEVLEYLSTLSVLVAVFFYFSESGDRVKLRHYQAWQVINTAQGKGGSGGRIEALQELNADRVSLVGVDLSGAFLQGIRLRKANLVRSNFSRADARGADLDLADFSDANLQSANFRDATLHGSLLSGTVLDDADLTGADLTGADLSDASCANVDLQDADLRGIRWERIRDFKMANIYGVRNAPEGFVAWALRHGAVQVNSEQGSN
jgi:hypothetical protein